MLFKVKTKVKYCTHLLLKPRHRDSAGLMIDETKRYVKLIIMAQSIGAKIEAQLVSAGDVTRIALY